MADRSVWGFVRSTGKVETGTGYRVTHDSNGTYTVLFDVPFNTGPAVVATQCYPGEKEQGGDTRDNAVIVSISSDRCRIVTGEDDGAKVDRDFTFIAIGGGA